MSARSICVCAVLISISLCFGCGDSDQSKQSTAIAVSAGAPNASGTGLAAPAFNLIDQAGQPFASSELAGKVWIANFIFTRCTATCPIQTANLARLQQSLADAKGANDLSFVSISVDPEFDRPGVLQKYADEHHANTDTWKFLTGSRDEIVALSEKGFKLPVNEAAKTGQGLIMHSPRFVLVDRKGQIVGFYEGTDAGDLAKLEAKVRTLLTATETLAAASATTQQTAGVPGPPKTLYLPPGVQDPNRQNLRRALQLSTRTQFKSSVIHDFSFTDTQPTSGIDFLERFVEDQGKTFKPVHYDHGTAVAVADVDGDGLLDIYFVSQLGPNGLYRNLGNGKFENITAKAGVAADGPIHVAASFADIDNDGDADLYVTCVRSPNILFENSGGGVFKDISADSGLAYDEHSSAAEFFDYDRDGKLDVFLSVVGQYTGDNLIETTGTIDSERLPGPPRKFHQGLPDAFAGHLKPERSRKSLLFHNEGGNRFKDVTDEVGLDSKGWSGDATPTDFNNDGWIDLYILSMQGHNEYWVNENGKKFTNKTREVFGKTPWGAMGVKSFDYNNDGNMDLMVTDMHSDMSRVIGLEQEKLKSTAWINDSWPETFLKSEGRSIYGNAFYRNKGNGAFEEVSDAIGAENFWPWGPSVGDLNADGWQDMYITAGMSYPYNYQPNTLLLNNAGEKFLGAEYLLGAEPRRDGRVAKAWFQAACGGADKDCEACRGQTGDIVVIGALGSRSSAIFDLDNDGDLDIVTNECGDVPMVLTSSLAKDRGQRLHFVKVKLVGTKSNRDALGARVLVTTGDRKMTQVNDGQSGYLGQSSLPLYFGIGPADKIDRIDVTWPSGAKSSVEQNLKINDVIEITEPRE